MSARTPSGHAWDVDWTIRDLVVGLAPVVATTLLMRLAPSALGTAGGTAVWLGQLLWMAAFPLALRRRRRAGPAIARVDLVGVGYGLLGGVGLLLLSSVWMLAFADAQAMNDARGPAEVVARGALWVSVAFVVLAGTLGPWIEETYFRGFLLHALRRRLPGAAAVAIQAVLFSFCHGYGWSATALIAAMGLVLGVLARRHATLVIAVTAHVTVNAAATLSWTAEATREVPWIGVGYEPARDGQGLVVTSVAPESPAERGGLRTGDTLEALDGQELAPRPGELTTAVRARAVGDDVTLRVRRGAERLTLRVTLGRRAPAPDPPAR